MFRGRILTICFFFTFFTVVACSYPISKEVRQEARKDLSFPQVLQNPTAYKGSTVIWGGSIVQTINRTDGTDIIVLETPLERQERPESDRYSQGRFIVRSPKFLDPEIYKNGRKITVAGEIVGQDARPLGQVQYNYPLLEAKEIYLWNPAAYSDYPAYPYGSGWYGWAPPFWDDMWY
jgi:outer membrane lipoprotein